ncbi:hypothetical protein RJ640_012207 [Escallonia rubra]|uniref:DUF1421 domain-containing protein n=1 Tax=Escallonia rubra TaxID=112253 RepID=A0AA88R390_9ASTE|nr:hypothetical protein RJ640_012207 [Escallonia rubra]
MASGSSGRNNSASKGFDFAADDILCSYEDYPNQDASNGSHSDSGIATNSKEFHKSRMARSSVFPSSAYSPPEESINQDLISTVERTMKKYADNLMRFLEGLSSRLSQLELYCYNLDKSIGEMRVDLVRDHGEADSKLKFLEKHLQEVHRSVQILRDKQELAETQKELAKLQLAQKESSANEDRTSSPASDPKKSDNTSDVHGQQLALALPQQVAPQPSLPSRPVEQQQQPQPQPPLAPPPQLPPQSTPLQSYYLPPAPAQPSQGQYLTSDSQYRTPPPQPAQSQANQVPQYQQQWPQQIPQQVQPPPQPPMQPQMRPSSTAVYPPYMSSQSASPSPPEALPNSMAMQGPFSGISQPGSSRAEAMPYGYGGPGRTMQQQPLPQHLKASFGAQPGDGYVPSGSLPTLSPGNAYMMYESEGGRGQHPPQPPHFTQSGYSQNPQPPTSSNLLVRPPQFVRSHPYNELVEQLANMGYRQDHVVSVIQRLEESGQTVDFNAVLDGLNGHSSGSSHRGWSG